MSENLNIDYALDRLKSSLDNFCSIANQEKESKDKLLHFLNIINTFIETQIQSKPAEQDNSNNCPISHALALPEIINLLRSLYETQSINQELDTIFDNLSEFIIQSFSHLTTHDHINNEDFKKFLNDNKHIIIKWLNSLGNLKGNNNATLQSASQATTKETSTRARAYSFGTSKVENTAFDPSKNHNIYDEEVVCIDVSKRTSKRKHIDTLLSIDFNDMKKNGVSIPRENFITPYDKEIHNAIVTLVAIGNEFINPSMIFQLLSGNTGKRTKISNETRENIMQSIRKMMMTLIRIDATAEVQSNMLTDKKGIYEGPLIPAERIEVIELNGQRVTDCIHLFRTPPLYEYARDKNQIGSIEISMLDTPLSNTSENIELKGYLLRRIASLKNSKNNMSDTIRYDTIFEYLRINAPTKEALKKKHQEIKKKVKQLLDFWIEKGLISSYKEEKEGKSIAKITITIQS